MGGGLWCGVAVYHTLLAHPLHSRITLHCSPRPLLSSLQSPHTSSSYNQHPGDKSHLRTTILKVNIILCCHGEGLACVSSVGLILVWRNIILFALINVSFQCFSVSATVTEPSSNQDNFYKTFNFLHDPSSCSFCVHSPPLYPRCVLLSNVQERGKKRKSAFYTLLDNFQRNVLKSRVDAGFCCSFPRSNKMKMLCLLLVLPSGTVAPNTRYFYLYFFNVATNWCIPFNIISQRNELSEHIFLSLHNFLVCWSQDVKVL